MQTTITMKPMNRVNLVVERGKENQDLLAPFHIRSQCLIQVSGLFCMVSSGSELYQNLLPDKIFGFKVLFTDLVSRLVTYPFISILYSIVFTFLSNSAGSLFPVRSQVVSFSFRESLDTNMRSFVYRLNFVKWFVLTWLRVISLLLCQRNSSLEDSFGYSPNTDLTVHIILKTGHNEN